MRNLNSSITKQTEPGSQESASSPELNIDVSQQENIIPTESSSTEDTVKMYLKEIGKAKLLSKEEEA